jgi:hypothetical protein
MAHHVYPWGRAPDIVEMNEISERKLLIMVNTFDGPSGPFFMSIEGVWSAMRCDNVLVRQLHFHPCVCVASVTSTGQEPRINHRQKKKSMQQTMATHKASSKQ